MKVLIRLDLSRYTMDTVKRLYTEAIITKDEYESELRERGYKDLEVLVMVRDAKRVA